MAELPAINTTNPILTSTNFDARYTIDALIPVQAITYFNGEIELRRDFLGSSVLRRIKAIRNYIPYTYKGYEQFTTICYKMYGNTTVAFIILVYNGLQHPLELIPGSILKLPDLTPFNNFLTQKASLNQNNIGKVVII